MTSFKGIFATTRMELTKPTSWVNRRAEMIAQNTSCWVSAGQEGYPITPLDRGRYPGEVLLHCQDGFTQTSPRMDGRFSVSHGGVTVGLCSGTTSGGDVGSTEHPCKGGLCPVTGCNSEVPPVNVDALLTAVITRIHGCGLPS